MPKREPVSSVPAEREKTRAKHALTPAMVANKWKKGQPSPNPKGRPKGSLDVWARIRQTLQQRVKQGEHKGKEFLDLVAIAFVKEVVKGKWPQMKELLDREEGKVPDRFANADGSNIELVDRSTWDRV